MTEAKKKYELLSGNHREHVLDSKGKKTKEFKECKVGDILELTEAKAEALKGKVKPVAASAAPAGPSKMEETQAARIKELEAALEAAKKPQVPVATTPAIAGK